MSKKLYQFIKEEDQEDQEVALKTAQKKLDLIPASPLNARFKDVATPPTRKAV